MTRATSLVTPKFVKATSLVIRNQIAGIFSHYFICTQSSFNSLSRHGAIKLLCETIVTDAMIGDESIAILLQVHQYFISFLTSTANLVSHSWTWIIRMWLALIYINGVGSWIGMLLILAVSCFGKIKFRSSSHLIQEMQED